MEQQQSLKQFFAQLAENFGPGFDNLSQDVKQQLRTAAQSAFDKMELVTRDEFEANRSVLMRSREKIQELEKIVADLEERLKSDKSA